MSSVQNPKHIIIVGAGYAGLKAATRLARKTRHDNVHITLVNGSDHFVERIRLHQLAADQPLKHITIRDLLRRKIRLAAAIEQNSATTPAVCCEKMNFSGVLLQMREVVAKTAFFAAELAGTRERVAAKQCSINKCRVPS